MDKKTILSGIQPSGSLCLGNYLGALKNWNHLQNEYNSIFLVVDMHALTVDQVPSDLRQRCLSFVAQYIACGIDPDESIIVDYQYQKWDRSFWPHSSKGFFKLKSKIPKILKQLNCM